MMNYLYEGGNNDKRKIYAIDYTHKLGIIKRKKAKRQIIKLTLQKLKDNTL